MRKHIHVWLLFAVAGIAGIAMASLAEPVRAQAKLLERPAQSSPRASTSVLLAVTRVEKRLVAVGELGIVLLTDDNGNAWRQAKVPVSVALTNVRFASGSKGWAVGHGGVVLHSADGGETWVKQLDGTQAAQLEFEAAKAESGQGGAAAQRRLADAQRLVAGGPDKPFLDVYFYDENNGLIVGAYGLIFATRDGGKNWQSLMGRVDNPKGKHLYSIHAAGVELYIAGEQGALYRSRDSGKSFTEVKTPYAGTYFGVVTGKAGELVVFGLRGNAYWSGDGSASWQKIDMGIPVTLTAGTRLSDGSLLLVDATGRVLRSGDGGRSFKPVPIPQPFSFTGVAQAANGALILCGARGITRIAPDTLLTESRQ